MQTPRRPLLAGAIALIAIVGCVSETDDPADAAKTRTADQPAPTEKSAAEAKTAEKSASTDAPEANAKTAQQPAAKQPDKSTVGRKFTPKDYRDAKTQLKVFCITCHGVKGKGDGPAALALNPKPRNWTDPKWHASVTDDQIFKVIRLGGAKNGLSPLMAPNPQFQDRPGAIHALVKLVRGFKDK